MERENYKYFDKRQRRPRLVRDVKNDVSYVLRHNLVVDYGKSKLDFWPPNLSSIFINIAHKAFQQARDIHTNHIKKYQSKNEEFEIDEKETVLIYDYLENIQVSIIMICTSIESLVNSVIPATYTFKKRYKGELKEYDYYSIQREIGLIDKIKYILPDSLGIKNFSNEKFWSKFQRLVFLRNELIHMKSSETSTVYNQKEYFEKLDENIISRLLNDNTIGLIQSGFDLIDQLYKSLSKKVDFPIWKTEEPIDLEVVDNFLNHFTKVRGPKK